MPLLRLMASKQPARRARGEVQELILHFLADSDPSLRFTPYAIAQQINVTPGSATAAVKALINFEKVTMFGSSPLIIGRK